ncbi:acetylcholinesterase-1 isoform X1 [Rhipicephalus sanguineus]|uniref:acetylcholinesterase-1 isoform X1 n=1 Tax=Rhipicephalus sanguineus TaxID=34632 RepID=UPI0020C4E7D1|nr:acetylcholinesterase-1 isoform X1 [Rhipicephalus sanguineus]
MICPAFMLSCLLALVSAGDVPQAYTETGLVSGERLTVNKRQVDAFLGIPYATPPVGDLRFKKPEPAKPWKGTRSATKKPLPCVQTDLPLADKLPFNYSSSSEDCLYLNVWRPSKHCAKSSPKCSAMLPVVVFVHGGGFQWGDSGLFLYDGSNFAPTADVVFVTFNYRVSIFGFLSLDSKELPGNMGLWDQNLLLKWVRANIAYFGGDASDVTLWGQSAGGASVGFHAVSPHSKGLFKRIIMQSGTPALTILNVSHRKAARMSAVADAVGCFDHRRSLMDQVEDVLSCMKRVDARKIIDAVSAEKPLNQFYPPTHGDEFLPGDPLSDDTWNHLNTKELFTGHTANEGNFLMRNIRRSAPVLDNILSEDYRFITTVVLSVMFQIPVYSGRQIVKEYFGDYDEKHSKKKVLEILDDMFGDVVFNCPTMFFAEKASQQGIDTYAYIFAHLPTTSPWPNPRGPTHADDIPFMLGSLDFVADPSKLTDVVTEKAKQRLAIGAARITPEERQLADQLQGMLSAYIRTGKPKIPLSNAEWPKYTAQKPEFVYLQPSNYTRGLGPKRERCEYWRPFLLKQSEGAPATQQPLRSETSSTESPLLAKSTRPAVQEAAPKSDVRLELHSSSYIPEPSAVLFTFVVFIIWICMA